LLGEPLEFLPRARGDVDAIVALVTQIEASALVPALKYHFADEVPVYATSQTVRGADAAALRELEGFRVSELPWFTHEFASYQALRDAFGLDGSPFAALYALGVDAFRLTERTPRLLAGNNTAMLGSTGVLEFLPDGRIQRHLARTVVHGGKLVEANAAPGR
jgi:outer membrane PBP1 activator LpoA protein